MARRALLPAVLLALWQYASTAGIFDPSGMGNMLFAVLAVAAQLDRDYIREKTLEGQQAAAARGNYGGRPKVVDPDMLVFARAVFGEPDREAVRAMLLRCHMNGCV